MAFSKTTDLCTYWKLAFKAHTTDVLNRRSERKKSTIAIMMDFIYAELSCRGDIPYHPDKEMAAVGDR